VATALLVAGSTLTYFPIAEPGFMWWGYQGSEGRWKYHGCIV